jgi:hypothetical protein
MIELAYRLEPGMKVPDPNGGDDKEIVFLDTKETGKRWKPVLVVAHFTDGSIARYPPEGRVNVRGKVRI